MSKFFNTNKKGEQGELKEELQSDSQAKQKDAIKKVIASMTVGRDVSSLFADVTRLISTGALDIKKLVYLYVMNNAKSQPEKAVLLAGSFVRDTQSENPLIRGLAIRTMSAVNVEKMADYLAEPLRRALRDNDPYVRKCAAIAVVKMFTINRSKTEDGGFLDILCELLTDSVGMVISNAVAALTEIREMSLTEPLPGAGPNSDIGEFRPQTIHTLLNALNEAPEWGQAYILQAVGKYKPKNQEEADMIAERVVPRLQHSNASVVLSAIQVLVGYLDVWLKNLTTEQQDDTLRKYYTKMAPPLVSLVSGGQESEIRYVALRNVTLIAQRFPTMLTSQIKVFFVKYNDPIYIKLEKLEIMLLLVDPTTVEICLSEFKEYAQEVDVEYVRKSVRAIGRAAIKIDSATQKCIDVLMALIKTRVNYVVQEAIIVIKDIFRKYPNQYESIIGALCESLDTLDEPDAKASMIWIIGEYAERIENADELMEMFVESFEDEVPQVKLAILTGTVKLFLKRPDSQELLQRVLKLASESEIPDLRDRGFVYWRLLSQNVDAAKEVILADRESINDTTTRYEQGLLNELLYNIGTLASVYHKPPSSFLADFMQPVKQAVVYNEDEEDEWQGDDSDQPASSSAPQPPELDLLADLDDITIGKPATTSTAARPAAPATTAKNPVSSDPLDFLSGPAIVPQATQAQPKAAAAASPFDDFFGGPAPTATQPKTGAVQRTTVIQPDPSKGGSQVDCALTQLNGHPAIDIAVTNKGSAPLMGFALQINKNLFGLALGHKPNIPEPLLPGVTHTETVPLAFTGGKQPISDLQVALKSNAGVVFGTLEMPLSFIINKSVQIDKQSFLGLWKQVSEEANSNFNTSTGDHQQIQNKLEQAGISFTANRPNPPNNHMYFAFKTLTDVIVLVELVMPQSNSPQASLCLRSPDPSVYPSVQSYIQKVLM